MKSKNIMILLLGFTGFVASYFKFIEWLAQNNFDFWGGWNQVFTAIGFPAGLQADLTFCALVGLLAALYDRKQLGFKWVVGIFISTIFLAASLGFALYVVRIGKTKSPNLNA